MANLNLFLIASFVIFSGLLYLCFSKETKWKALLISSMLFYTIIIGEKIIVVLIISLIIYYASFLKDKKYAIGIGVISILIPILLSKIFNSEAHFDAYQSHGAFQLAFLQILGLSYFGFNGISYLVDIKRKYVKPEKNYFLVLLYLIYLPTVFSGPLHRAKYLITAFKNIQITDDSISTGLRLILWGLFKNLVVADRLFKLVASIINSEITGFYYLGAGVLFALYLYCNFSSFIDFFQGVSKLFGVQLKNNFKNRIYFAPSREEFWSGWHITLNEWFRDYFFFVILKVRKKNVYPEFLLMCTLILIALWHEFSSALLLWGFLNGVWIILEKRMKLNLNTRLKRILGTFYHLTLSGFLTLVFISPSISLLYDRLLSPASFPSEFYMNSRSNIFIVLLSFGIMDYYEMKAKNKKFDNYLGEKSIYTRWFIYFKLSLWILIFTLNGSLDNYYNQF